MKINFLILVLLITTSVKSQPDILHNLTLKFLIPNGQDKNRFWNRAELESEDTVLFHDIKLFTSGTTIKKIPSGKYKLRLKSIFEETIDTAIILANKKSVKITIAQTEKFYSIVPDSVLLTTKMKAIDSIFLVCKFYYKQNLEYLRFKFYIKDEDIYIKKYKDLNSSNSTKINTDLDILLNLVKLEGLLQLKLLFRNIENQGYGTYESYIFNYSNKIKIYSVSNRWEDGFEFIKSLNDLQ